MQAASNFATARRDGTGLAITIALHAGVAALALIGFNIAVNQRQPPAPIVTHNIPDPPAPSPAPLDPALIDQPIPIDVAQPVWITDEPPITDRPIPTRPAAASDPIVLPPIPAGPPVAAQPAGITRIARFDPRYAADAQPPYPPAAARLGEAGTVVVHVLIGRDGRVIEATLSRTSGSPRLDAAAIAQAMKKWRFTPALKDGEPVEAMRDISVRFRLEDARG